MSGSFHEPLAMVIGRPIGTRATWLGKQFNLPLVEDVDYETQAHSAPGAKKNLPCITVLELPPVSSDRRWQYLDAFVAVLGCEG